MDSSRTMAEHLRTISAMIRDLKAAGKEISIEEQVLNVIQALKMDAVQSRLKIEEECVKCSELLRWLLLLREIGPKTIRTSKVGNIRKVLASLKRVGQMLVLLGSKRLKVMGKKI